MIRIKLHLCSSNSIHKGGCILYDCGELVASLWLATNISDEAVILLLKTIIFQKGRKLRSILAQPLLHRKIPPTFNHETLITYKSPISNQ